MNIIWRLHVSGFMELYSLISRILTYPEQLAVSVVCFRFQCVIELERVKEIGAPTEDEYESMVNSLLN